MAFLIAYLLIGLGFYLGVAMARRYMFNGASALEIVGGIVFGLLLWPLAMLHIMGEVDQ